MNNLIIPLLIFTARIFDVSIGTVRLIFISKGYKRIAPILGFFEVLIWITVISQVMKHAEGIISFIAYAGGFATGTYVGMIIEEKFTNGKVLIRVIVKKNAVPLIENLRLKKYKVTSVEAEGNHGPVKILFIVTKKTKLPEIVKIIRDINPKAFYTIEDLRFAMEHEVRFRESKPAKSPSKTFQRTGK
jgi:uncharacterized protein YebE (UPF0316 family)